MASLKNKLRQGEETWDKTRLQIKEQLNLIDPVIIYPYHGFGNHNKAYLHGRILEKERFIHGEKDIEDSFWNNLRKLWKRYESDEIPGVRIEANFGGSIARATSDGEGFFTLLFDDLEKLNLQNGWHSVEIRIIDMPFDIDYEEHAVGEVLISRQDASSFGIISDVDDTIIKSHAMNPFQKLSTMLTKNAESRVPFEGVEKLYESLTNGSKNPLLFVSGSSYNLFDMLKAFSEHNGIPQAPFLLRQLGLDADQWLKQDTKPYKMKHINEILEVFDKLSFICIGDSGQQDPEIYREVHRKHPGRIKAIYIRHVHTDERKAELEKMAEEMDIPFLVMENSQSALQHAQEMGWVS